MLDKLYREMIKVAAVAAIVGVGLGLLGNSIRPSFAYAVNASIPVVASNTHPHGRHGIR